MTKPTHREQKTPKISTSMLADYMVASEQAKRTIIRNCKYRPIARLVQYHEAKAIIANHLREGAPDTSGLAGKIELLESRIVDDEFEADVRDHNCDFLRRFITIKAQLNLPKCQLFPTTKLPALNVNGTMVTFGPDLLVSRTTKTNKSRAGAIMLRYAKGKALKPDVGRHQASFIYGYLRQHPMKDNSEADKSISLVIDCHAGEVYEAPGNAVYQFKELEALCASVAERWAAIKPPPGAILA